MPEPEIEKAYQDEEDDFEHYFNATSRLTTENQELKAENERLKKEITKRPAKPLYGEARSLILRAMDAANINDAIEKWEKLQTENKRLKKALDKFGRHAGDCAYIQQLNAQVIAECDCGYEKALKGE